MVLETMAAQTILRLRNCCRQRCSLMAYHSWKTMPISIDWHSCCFIQPLACPLPCSQHEGLSFEGLVYHLHVPAEVLSSTTPPSLPRTAGSAVEVVSQDERLARVLHRAAWQNHSQPAASDTVSEDAREQGWTLAAIAVGKSAQQQSSIS